MLGERFENLEGPDGLPLQEPRTSLAAFSGHMKSTQGGEPQLAYYCGYLVSNYVTGPFILAKAVVATAVPDLSEVHDESWRRLKVTFPQRVVTHSGKQTFYFNCERLLRRQDYPAISDSQTQIAQVFWEHQRFSRILVSILLKIGINGILVGEPPLVDIEMFDAVLA